MIAHRRFRSAFLSAALNGLVLFFCLDIPRSAKAEIIPPDRRTDWTAGTIVGVPGGIPNRTRIFLNIVTDLGADPTGVSDVTAILKNALVNCPEGQVVYVPAGTYKVGNLATYQTGKNKTLRGAGMGRTIFKPTGGAPFRVGVDDEDHAPRAVSGGANKGSTVINVADTSNVAVGELVRIEAASPPKYIYGKTNMPNPQPNPLAVGSIGGTLGWMFRVTGVTSDTISFSPPLPMDISGRNPRAVVYNSYGAAGTVVGYGFEDFTVDKTGNSNGGIMAFDQAYGCWVKNVEFKNFSGQCLTFISSINCEARGCYLHGGGGGSGGEGFDLVGNDSWNLIEDNIVYNGGGIVLNDANSQVSGNVIAYNYIYAHHNSVAALQVADVDLGHGTQDTLNLVEGNIMGSLHGGDSYYGGASHNTIFRNWITADNPYGDTNGRVAVKLKQANVYTNVVGNVLGTPAFPVENNGVADGDASPPNGPAARGGYYQAPRMSGYDNGASSEVSIIYELGFPNIGNSGFNGTIRATDPPDYSGETSYNGGTAQKYDENVQATLLRHGNYDYFNRATIWDESISDHTLPNSLFRSVKPDWWPANMVWPPFGPDRTPMTGSLPAKARYEALSRPPPSPPANVTISAPPS